MTDAVITYVNGTDPKWQAVWKKAVLGNPAFRGQNIAGARWRDYGTLPTLIHGIRRFMPFVRNIFVVVSGQSQAEYVPKDDGVIVVQDADIIPQKLLPTFNSTCIELFLYRIPGLAEQFIYFNDDMFPVGQMKEEDFFRDGMPCLIVSQYTNPVKTTYACHLTNSLKAAAKAIGYERKGAADFRFGHTAAPMLRSSWERLWRRIPDVLLMSCSPFRTSDNINQEVVNYLHFLEGYYYRAKRKTRYVKASNKEKIATILRENMKCQILCINDHSDVDFSDELAAFIRDELRERVVLSAIEMQ